MFWPQVIVSFILWIAYGIRLSRRSATIRTQLRSLSRNQRIAYGSLCLVGSMALICLMLAGVLSLGGFKGDSLTIPVWLVVTFAGIGFVHAQAFGTAMLVTVAQEPVTTDEALTSTSKESSDSGVI